MTSQNTQSLDAGNKPVIGGKYNWVNQPDRLIYLGKKGAWHQFKKIGDPREVWCEVLDEDLPSIEETRPEPAGVVEAGTVGVDLAQLLADVKEAVQVSDNVGRSRGSNCYAMNGGAVVKICNLMASIEHRFALLAATSAKPADEVIRSNTLKEAADLCMHLENNLSDGAEGFGADGADCYAAIMALRAGLPLGEAKRLPPSGAAVKMPKFTKEWCLRMAQLEADFEGAAVKAEPVACRHRFMYFGDQAARRCADCNQPQPPTAEGQTNEQGRDAEGAVSEWLVQAITDRALSLAASPKNASELAIFVAELRNLLATQPPSASPAGLDSQKGGV